MKKSTGGKVTEEDEENQGIKKTEKDFIEETAKIRYQNVLLISRLEQSEEVENELKKEIRFLRDKIAKSETEEDKRKKSKEEEWIAKETQEWIKEKEVLTQEVETCLTEKRTMKEELDRARLEIHALRQYKQLKWNRKKETARGSGKTGRKP